MFILKPSQTLNQYPAEEYTVVVKNGIEYFYKYCSTCNEQTSWCPIMACCEVCASQ